MAKLSEEAKKIISEIQPALVATASKSGKPNISAKESFHVLDDEHVAFAEIASPRTLANLRENPQISAIVFSPKPRRGCRIWGRAEILDSGDQFNTVSAYWSTRGIKVNHLVKVVVEEVITF